MKSILKFEKYSYLCEMSKETFDIFNEYPFVTEFDFATVYSKSKLGKWEVEELSSNKYLPENKYQVTKSERIGVLSDEDDNSADVIIVATKNMNYYISDGPKMISDDSIYFEVSKGLGYCPSSEPVDLLETGYENGGGSRLENHLKLKEFVKKFELDYFLLGV